MSNRSPVPTYFVGLQRQWQEPFAQSCACEAQEQGAQVGWMDALTLEAPAYSDHWSAVMMDDAPVHARAAADGF